MWPMRWSRRASRRAVKGDGIDMLWSALVAGVLALLSALSDNVWFNGKSPIWLVVMVAWFIGIVPNLIDIAKWLLGVRSSFRPWCIWSSAGCGCGSSAWG